MHWYVLRENRNKQQHRLHYLYYCCNNNAVYTTEHRSRLERESPNCVFRHENTETFSHSLTSFPEILRGYF